MGILDTPSYSRAQADTRFGSARYLANTQRRQAVPMSTKAALPVDSANGLSAAGVLGGTAKLAHLATRSGYGIQLAFTNWRAAANNTEADGPNVITVRAAVEPVGNIVVPVTFGGARSVDIPPGATVFSDPVGVDVVKGSTFFSRTFVQVASGGQFPLGNVPTASSGEGNNYGTTVGADLTATGSASLTGVGTNQYVFGPSAILGQPVDPGKPVVAICGDSIFHGVGDPSSANGGYAQRALANNYSFVKVAYPGEALSSGWLGNFGLQRYRRVGLLARCGVTHVVTDYTVNSLGSITIQQEAVTAWGTFARIAPGAVWATTLTPQTTSTDGWATAANQFVADSTKEGRRIAFNTWLRDGAPIDGALVPQAPGSSAAGVVRAGQAGHPLTGYFEAADLAETARNSGIWKAGYTADGTHPSAAGHAALAGSIDPTVFGPVSTVA